MKTLYLVGGTMGVGKSTVSRLLRDQLPAAAMLDGDWCWNARPFTVNDETRAMVIDNICHVLGNFLRCSAYENVVFCWVMHEQAIVDEILARLPLAETGCRVVSISLTCTETELRARLERDIAAGTREKDVVERSVARLSLYQALNSALVDTTGLTPREVAKAICSIEPLSIVR